MIYFDIYEKIIKAIIFCLRLELKENGQKKLIKLRQKVNSLYFKQGMKKSAIARQERVSRNFVIKWTTTPKQNYSEDKRGWAKGMRRKWNDSTESRIKEIHKYT